MSEEQHKPIGTCPICNIELTLFRGKVDWHECYPDEAEDITRQYVMAKLTPHKLERMVEDILYVNSTG